MIDSCQQSRVYYILPGEQVNDQTYGFGGWVFLADDDSLGCEAQHTERQAIDLYQHYRKKADAKLELNGDQKPPYLPQNRRTNA